MNILIVLLLITALLLTRVSKLHTAIYVLFVQSIIITLACIFMDMEHHSYHVLVAAFLTLVIKAGIIPYTLLGMVKRIKKERETRPILNANYSFISGCVAIMLAYSLLGKSQLDFASRDGLAAAIALTLIGLMLIMTRRQAVMQTVALITMENGVYLVGLSTTKGLPLIIELGVFFDVLVAVAVLVLLTYRLKLSFMSTDTGLLRKLKG